MTMLLEPFGSLFETQRRRQLRGDPGRTFFPPADLLASEDEMTLVMDVPGFKSDDLEIELRKGMLRIRGERRYPYAPDHSGRSIHRLERGYGRFERLLKVPEDVDPGDLTATIEEGVLTLRIPLPETRKPHRIEIRSGETQRAIDAEWTTDGGQRESDESTDGRELAGAGA